MYSDAISLVCLQYVDLDEFLSENGIPMDVPAPQQAPGLIGSTNMLTAPVTAPSPQQQPQPQPQLQQLHKLQVSAVCVECIDALIDFSVYPPPV